MGKYQRIGGEKSGQLRELSVRRVIGVAVAGLVSGFVVILTTNRVSRMSDGIERSVVFDLCLVAVLMASVVIAIVMKRADWLLTVVASVVVVWGSVGEAGGAVSFSIMVALVASCFDQVFRIRDMRVAMGVAGVVVVVLRLI